MGYNIGNTSWTTASGYADLSFVEGMLYTGSKTERMLTEQNWELEGGEKRIWSFHQSSYRYMRLVCHL